MAKKKLKARRRDSGIRKRQKLSHGVVGGARARGLADITCMEVNSPSRIRKQRGEKESIKNELTSCVPSDVPSDVPSSSEGVNSGYFFKGKLTKNLFPEMVKLCDAEDEYGIKFSFHNVSYQFLTETDDEPSDDESEPYEETLRTPLDICEDFNSKKFGEMHNRHETYQCICQFIDDFKPTADFSLDDLRETVLSTIPPIPYSSRIVKTQLGRGGLCATPCKSSGTL